MTTTLDLSTAKILCGSHNPPVAGEPIQGCVMEIVSYIACVSPVIAAFLRPWNDSLPDEPRRVTDSPCHNPGRGAAFFHAFGRAVFAAAPRCPDALPRAAVKRGPREVFWGRKVAK